MVEVEPEYSEDICLIVSCQYWIGIITEDGVNTYPVLQCVSQELFIHTLLTMLSTLNYVLEGYALPSAFHSVISTHTCLTISYVHGLIQLHKGYSVSEYFLLYCAVRTT